jgi:hypothetical protein
MKIEEITNFNKLELNGSVLTFYHRTRTLENANNIIEVGYSGSKLFGTYRLISTLGKDNRTGSDYGNFIIKCHLDLTNLKIATSDKEIISKSPSKFITEINKMPYKWPDDIDNGAFDVLLDADGGGDGYMIVVYGDDIKKVEYDKKVLYDTQ